MEVRVHTCRYCKKQFTTSGHELYCSKQCEDDAYFVKFGCKKSHQKPERKPENNLSQIAKEARDAGMTYGQYVAQKYAAQHKILREWI